MEPERDASISEPEMKELALAAATVPEEKCAEEVVSEASGNSIELERDNYQPQPEPEEPSPPEEKGAEQEVSKATGDGMELERDNYQPEPELEKPSPLCLRVR